MGIFIVYYVSKIETKAKVEGLENSVVKQKGQERSLVNFEGSGEE